MNKAVFFYTKVSQQIMSYKCTFVQHAHHQSRENKFILGKTLKIIQLTFPIESSLGLQDSQSIYPWLYKQHRMSLHLFSQFLGTYPCLFYKLHTETTRHNAPSKHHTLIVVFPPSYFTAF